MKSFALVGEFNEFIVIAICLCCFVLGEVMRLETVMHKNIDAIRYGPASASLFARFRLFAPESWPQAW